MDNNNTMEYRIGLEKQNKRNDQVTELILDNCRASQISGLTDEFVNLETLSLINVGLVTLKGFPKLPKLKRLELSDNRLTGGLNLLHGSPKLQHLNISGNRIKDFEALEPLKEFHELQNLDLYNCEVTKTDDYRQKVFNLIPNLHSLDGYDRDEIEVGDSDESDDEASDVENRITRDDNDLDEEEGADDESSEFDEEEDYNGVEMGYEEEDDDEEEGEENDDDDDDDEEGLDEDEEDFPDEAQATEGVASRDGLTSGGDASASGNEATNGEPSLGQLETFENGEELDDNDDDDDDIDDIDDEEDGSDLKQLQNDIGDDEDSDDDDFEPDQEPDERDYEIDPEDDADVDESGDLLSTSNTAATATPVNIDSDTKQRGQKRKHEDGGDEVSER